MEAGFVLVASEQPLLMAFCQFRECVSYTDAPAHTGPKHSQLYTVTHCIVN